MTVIAASVADGCMAADRWCLDVGDTHFPLRKVYRVRGRLIGMAGTVAHILEALAWFRRGEPPEETPGGDVTALILSKTTLKTWTPQDGFVTVDRGWHAIGSGGACALGALVVGADVRRAVLAACEVHTTCGGGASVYKV